jgi:hypothetical protein
MSLMSRVKYHHAHGYRSQRTKAELPVSGKIQPESHYAYKRQKLEGGRSRQGKSNYITIFQLAYDRLIN